MHDELLTIGRFARLCRLGVKQLRRYDEMGLLAPIHVNAGSGIPGLEFVALPGGPVPETVPIGPYAQLPLAYNAIFAAVHERGLRPQAPVREASLVGPAEAPPEELMTRLIIPIQESMHDEGDRHRSPRYAALRDVSFGGTAAAPRT